MSDSDTRGGFSAIPRHLFGSLTAYELAVIAAIHSRYPNAYPSHHLLAHDAGMSVSSVQRTLVSLKEKGLVEVQSGQTEGRSNVYILSTAFFGGVGQRDRGGRSQRPTGSVRETDEVEQPSRPREEKTQNPSGSGSAEGDDVVRSVRDDDQEMPEYGNETKRKKKPKGEAPPPGTSARLVWKFREECKRLRVYRFNISHLNRLTDSLREEEEKLSNEEIEIVIDVFFARYGEDVRHKREIDPVRMFHQQINSGLVRQCDDLIAKHRRGGYDKPKTKNKYAEMWREQYG